MIWKWLRRRGAEKAPADTAQPVAAAMPKPAILEIGRVDAVCPQCEKPLPKKPGRKAKCPHCGNFIYVRTRPSDRQRVLVTEAQTAEIEEQWELLRETPSLERIINRYVGREEAFKRERVALAAKFGGPPSDSDVLWSLLNKQLVEYSSEGKWGLYRNTRFDMAEVLHADGRLKAALATYLEVCYLDINGPRNTAGTSNPKLLEKYPPFSPKEGFLAPGVLQGAEVILRHVTLDRNEVRSLFLDHVQQHCCHLNLPVPAERGWPRIEAELFGSGS